MAQQHDLGKGDEYPVAGTDTARTIDDDTHGFVCDCGFTSVGWPTKKARDARKREHSYEHAEGKPASELVAFRREHGVEA